MPAAPFAALEARLTDAVFRRIANAVAQLDGVDVAVIFDRAYGEAFGGMGTTEPVATLPSNLCNTATNASVLVVGGNTYRVRSVQPDGTGVSLLRLELQ